jgi:hypothetical protein
MKLSQHGQIRRPAKRRLGRKLRQWIKQKIKGKGQDEKTHR